jgi:predicted transcriptional regulator
MSSKVQVRARSSRWVRKRSDVDITANILKEARLGARKTRIMYRCNLSHRQLGVYLKLLMGLKLLACPRRVNHADVFETSAKGIKFLDAYRTLKALMI